MRGPFLVIQADPDRRKSRLPCVLLPTSRLFGMVIRLRGKHQGTGTSEYVRKTRCWKKGDGRKADHKARGDAKRESGSSGGTAAARVLMVRPQPA